MYQFPLGVFAIALATAIFPKLASGAHGEGIRHRDTEGTEVGGRVQGSGFGVQQEKSAQNSVGAESLVRDDANIQRRDAESAEGAQRRDNAGSDGANENRVEGSGQSEGGEVLKSAVGQESAVSDGIDYSKRPDAARVTAEFKTVLRRGLEACMFIGLPASIGLIVVREPATRFLFQHGAFTESDARWVALSTALYSSAIWAFSLQQVLSRAYYALHDTVTPLVASILTLVVNLAVELPLLWTPLGEAGMAAGTAVSFAVQALVMLNMLRRRLGTLGLSQSVRPVAKMMLAAGLMWLACWAISSSSAYELVWIAKNKLRWAIQLFVLMGVGGAVYVGACMAMGIDVMTHVRRKKSSPQRHGGTEN